MNNYLNFSASTNAILLLISKLISRKDIRKRFSDELAKLIPRLWPFLYHVTTSVQTSALEVILSLIQVTDADEESRVWLPVVFESLMDRLMQRGIVEGREENANTIVKVWFDTWFFSLSGTYYNCAPSR